MRSCLRHRVSGDVEIFSNVWGQHFVDLVLVLCVLLELAVALVVVVAVVVAAIVVVPSVPPHNSADALVYRQEQSKMLNKLF